MKLAVKLYETEEGYPENFSLPGSWPSQVVELSDEEDPPDSTYQIMTKEEFESYKDSQMASYESWIESILPASVVIQTIEANQGLGKDYKYIRNQVIIAVAITGWSNLDLKNKKLAAQMFAVEREQRDEVFSLEKQIEDGHTFHKNSCDSRQSRREAAEVEVYNRIVSGAEQADLMADVSQMLDAYVQFGIEGTAEGDTIGLFDYVESRVGTPFFGGGLLAKTYSVEGMTIPQLSVRLMNILKNGDY